MKTLCVKDGKIYSLTSKIEKQLDGSYLASALSPDGNNCIVRWFIPYPVDVNNPSDWEEADEIKCL